MINVHHRGHSQCSVRIFVMVLWRFHMMFFHTLWNAERLIRYFYIAMNPSTFNLRHLKHWCSTVTGLGGLGLNKSDSYSNYEYDKLGIMFWTLLWAGKRLPDSRKWINLLSKSAATSMTWHIRGRDDCDVGSKEQRAAPGYKVLWKWITGTSLYLFSRGFISFFSQKVNCRGRSITFHFRRNISMN